MGLRMLILSAAALAATLLAGGAMAAQKPPFAAWAPTPPMGWNSYDCFSYGVTEQQVKQNADYMAAHLKRFGWKYIVVDYVWACPLSGADFAPTQSATFEPRLHTDGFGRLIPDEVRFPSAKGGKGFKALAAYVHSKGLKFGIHVMRGIPRQVVADNAPILGTSAHARDAADTASLCPWLNHMYGMNMAHAAGQAYLDSLLKLYAEWGVDLIKVDDLSEPYHTAEIEGYRKAIDRCGRPIVFSTSPGETSVAQAGHIAAHANMWRLLGDLWDDWGMLKHAFEVCARWQSVGGNGRWPDPDMLPLGRLRKFGPKTGPPNTNSLLTKDEQYTLMTLWCITRSPLMFGGNLPDTDAFTRTLITNPEVIAVNQRSANGRQLFRKNDLIAWTADVPGSRDKYLAVFNARDESRAAFRSDIVSRATPGQAVDIDADITGARELWLVVDDAGDGFNCDHADWAEPRIIGPGGERRLTDLKWRSATVGWGTPGLNKGVEGNDLIIDGRPVEYGIGAHSKSVIVYDLPAGYTRFKARGGLDRAGVIQVGGATVRFSVYTHDPAPRGVGPLKAAVSLADLGFNGPCTVRDLWRRKGFGRFTGTFAPVIPAHGAGLYRISPSGR